MGTIKLHAGSFGVGAGYYGGGSLTLPRPDLGFGRTESVAMPMIKTVEIASEESVKRLGGTVGWGIAGGVLLGPVGLLAGLLMGGNRKQITFVAEFHDHRRFLGTADVATYNNLLAATFKR